MAESEKPIEVQLREILEKEKREAEARGEKILTKEEIRKRMKDPRSIFYRWAHDSVDVADESKKGKEKRPI